MEERLTALMGLAAMGDEDDDLEDEDELDEDDVDFEDEDDDEDWDENTNWARGPSSPSSRYSCQNIRHPCLQFLNVRSSPIGLAAAGTFREIVIVQAGQRF